MVSSAEEDQRPEIAVGDIPRVAELIASIPVQQRAAALRAAELSYLQTAQDFGYPEDAARQWAAAALSKLRLEVDKQRWTIRMQLKLLYREAVRAGLGTESSDESGE
jgi:DNA-directed RNA polymerase specialized sigma24 family protein